jgi:hypothetical protein
MPSIIHGLLQTEDYAAALLRTSPGASDGAISGRLRARMERRRRVLLRDSPPAAWFIVDELSLYRLVGTPAIMTAQVCQLIAMATMPDITIQVLPAVAHPANASGFVIAMMPPGASTWPAASSKATRPFPSSSARSIPRDQKATAPPRRQHCSKGWPDHGQLAQVHSLRRQRRRLHRSRLKRCCIDA